MYTTTMRSSPDWGRVLEMTAKVAKRRDDNQFSGAAFDFGLFEFPRGGMRNEHSVEPDLQRGIHVASRAVADHPAMRFDDFELLDHALVCRGVLFEHDYP